jgi:hypothetical protein
VTMAESEPDYILELWGKNICPNCGKNIAEGTRVGSGRKSEGGFCSLDCYADFYKTDLVERAKRVSALITRHQNS